MLSKTLFGIALIAILAGFALSIVSWLELCSDMCVGTHNYRLLGFKFQDVGLLFFPILLITHLLSYSRPLFRTLTALLIAGALGSEAVFIWIQKYEINAWCPVCLSIAGTLAIAGITYFFYTRNNSMKIGFSSFSVFVIGILVGFFGVTKINPLDALEESVKENITFGNTSSPIEVYIFTDWQCPACRKVEPALPEILAAAKREAKVVFVDVDIHPETLNFIPYNLSFMMHNKNDYLKLRDKLIVLSQETGAPTENQVEGAIKPIGTRYQELNFADVAVGMKYFRHLASEFDVNSTPTVVIVNNQTKKGKKLYGYKEITKENVMNAISNLK